MGEARLRTRTGATAMLDGDLLDGLRNALRGELCLPDEAGYELARTVWNAMIDRRPGLVLRCAGAADVMQGVRLAREHDLLLAVKGGGHNIAGHAVCEGGLLLDLSPMRSVRVDPQARQVWVEPGCTLGDVDAETQTHGLAVPTGINSTTGIAGLTLGGGFGWLTRAFGMTIDNLLAADVVTADGALRHASGQENAELFWALRGGGGNFGVVTSFRFQLHPVGPEVLSGLVVHPFEQARDLLQACRELAAQAPDELTCWFVLRKAPPLPFLPEAWHGREVLILAMCYAGDMAAGERAVAPFRELGEPIADVVGPHPYRGWQAAFDPLLTPGSRNYWKSHDLGALSDAAIDVLLEHVGRLPSPQCEVFVAQLGGARGRVASEATAFPHRSAAYTVNVHTRWDSPAEDEACIGWARRCFDALAPHALGSVYVNFMPEDETERTAGAYGPNQAALARIKAAYDPDNLFRVNQNIRPEAGAGAG